MSLNKKISIINGPNLNLLGSREPEIYGKKTLQDIEIECKKLCKNLGIDLSFFQSNHEGEMVDFIQKAGEVGGAGIIINAGAYTHTSIALFDALTAVDVPAIELHLSNPSAREEFREKSYISKAVIGLICGFGADGYLLAIQAMNKILDKN